MTTERTATYRFVQHALSVGKPEALAIGLLAGTYPVKAGTLRKHVAALGNVSWASPLSAALWPFGKDEHLGRFRMLKTPWHNYMKPDGIAWATGIREMARAASPEAALAAALKLEKKDAKGLLSGAGDYQLGQILHLLHPSWFAIVNKVIANRWQKAGCPIGGIANLDGVSAPFRAVLHAQRLDFNVLDEGFIGAFADLIESLKLPGDGK